MSQPVNNMLMLPGKPFTLDEVQRITGCPSQIIDRWYGKELPPRTSEGGLFTGLSQEQAFAVFVGYRYLQEGSDYDRADSVVKYLGILELDSMWGSFEKGNAFVAFDRNENGHQIGVLIPPPDKPLGRKLDLRVLWREFGERTRMAFPNG